MSEFKLSIYKKDSSIEIVELLEKNYFQTIEEHCQKAGEYALQLKITGYTSNKNHATSPDIYISMCLGVIEDIKQCIKFRKENIIPYVLELAGKVTAGHDCSNCSTGCAVKHASKIPEIESYHGRTKDMFGRLERLSIPVYGANNSYAEIYKLLRNEMIIIQTAVIELFFIEESALIPKIQEEQKNIHARH